MHGTFAQRSPGDREAVLGAPGTARVAVEAASPFGWDRWIGERGAFIGMRSFGASGLPRTSIAITESPQIDRRGGARFAFKPTP